MRADGPSQQPDKQDRMRRPQLPADSDVPADAGREKPAKPFGVRPHEGPSFSLPGAVDTIKISAEQSGGRLGITEWTHVRGFASPLHAHEREDETVCVLEGQYRFFLGDDTMVASPGYWVFCPRGIPHAFRVESANARALCVIVPGGWETIFAEAGEPATDRTLPPPATDPLDVQGFAALAARYGVTILGPPPPGSA